MNAAELAVIWAYEEAYNNATGETATYRKGSSDYHTLKFVKWLAEQAERIRKEYTDVSVERSQLEKERDEARAEVERLRGVLQDIAYTSAHTGEDAMVMQQDALDALNKEK